MLPTVYATLIKDALALLVVCGVLFGVYEFGNNRGHAAGYTEGMAYQQPAIDALTKTINDERTAVEAKVQSIQITTANAVIAAQEDQVVKTVVRTQIVEHYNTVEKIVASECGLEPPTVTAINALLDTQTEFDNMSPPVATPVLSIVKPVVATSIIPVVQTVDPGTILMEDSAPPTIVLEPKVEIQNENIK